jgi:hypothetical protein
MQSIMTMVRKWLDRLILLVLTAFLVNCDRYTSSDYTYDSDWSMNVFRGTTVATPKIESIEVFVSYKNEGYADKCYKELTTLPKILDLKTQDQISKFMSAVLAKPALPEPPNAHTLIDEPSKTYHLVLWADNHRKSAYARLIVGEIDGSECGYIKAWDGAEHYEYNLDLIKYMNGSTKLAGCQLFR